MRSAIPVTRTRLEHVDFVANFLRRSPVVLEGALAQWPAGACWTPGYLREHYGDAEIYPERYDAGAGRSFLGQMLAFEHRESTLGEYLADLERESVHYAVREEREIFSDYPRMLEELDYCRPFWGRESPVERQYIGLWVGPRGYRTGLHADNGHLMLCQFHGRKRFVLFAPDHTAKLYPEIPDQQYLAAHEIGVEAQELRFMRQSVRWAQCDPLSPDYARFPALRDAIPYECVVGPGDMLYIPMFWWHAVEALDAAISVSIGIDVAAYRRTVKAIGASPADV